MIAEFNGSNGYAWMDLLCGPFENNELPSKLASILQRRPRIMPKSKGELNSIRKATELL